VGSRFGLIFYASGRKLGFILRLLIKINIFRKKIRTSMSTTPPSNGDPGDNPPEPKKGLRHAMHSLTSKLFGKTSDHPPEPGDDTVANGEIEKQEAPMNSANGETPAEPIRADKPNFLTTTAFDTFDLPPEVLRGLAEAQFVHCTPIQAQVLPVALEGKDIAGQAQTGTGKTGAFLVTILTRLLHLPDRPPDLPAAIIVAPTRELASQIHEEAMLIGAHTGLRFAQIVGGVDYQKQAATLKKGVDVVICTPGRIIDYFKQGIFKTAGIQMVVIDEADRLLDLGFARDMRFILRKLPHYEKRQSMLFSATLSHRVLELTYEYMNLPEFISVTPEEITVEHIDQTLIHVGLESKLSLLLGILEREDWHRVLIFANTKAGVEWLSEKLRGNGLPAEGITGDLPQRKRFRLMDQFKEDRVKILVATDVASRGIHIEDISHVINYDLPQDSESYVHRIGRTARAGKTGKAISLACENYVFHLEPLEEMLGYKIPVVWHEDEWLVKDQAGPVKSSRRIRSKRPARKKPRPRSGKPSSRRIDVLKDRPPDYFPGTFFGFAPDPDKTEAPSEEGPTKKKRRRWRRKKKPGSEVNGSSKTTNPATEKTPSKTETIGP
jgi:ATP-dependent RNA helicase RhlB